MKHVEVDAFLKLDGLLVRCVSQPTITIRNTGDASLATIYATNSQVAGQLKSNPFTGDATGGGDFYIPDTRYNVEISGGTPALGSTLVSSDNIAWDPFIHFNFTSNTSGYILQQNSAGLFTPVSPNSVTGGPYVLKSGDTMTGSLSVTGTLTVTGGGVNASYEIRSTVTNSTFANFVAAGPAGNLQAGVNNANGILFSSSGLLALQHDGTTNYGNVLIGTTTDNGEKLQVNGVISGNGTRLTTSGQIITSSKAAALTDQGVTQIFSSATNLTLTLSANAGFAAPLGTKIPIFRAGAGTVTVTSGGAVTILGTQFTVNSLSMAYLEKIATDTWLFSF